jgi:hypothetical protein
MVVHLPFNTITTLKLICWNYHNIHNIQGYKYMDIHGYPGQPAHRTSPVLIIVRGRVLQRIFNRLCPQPLDSVSNLLYHTTTKNFTYHIPI